MHFAKSTLRSKVSEPRKNPYHNKILLTSLNYLASRGDPRTPEGAKQRLEEVKEQSSKMKEI